MRSVFHSLGIFNYRLWFIGGLVSNIGTWMQRTAQDWLVLTELTDYDAIAVGITLGLQFAPQLLLFPLAGVVADHFDRRRLLVATQSSSAVLCFIFATLVLTGTIELWHVYVLAGLLGVVASFDAPSRQAFVGDLVSERNIPNAVALNSASFHGARLAGPAIAGVLIAIIGTGWVLGINAITYAAVISALLVLRKDELTPTHRTSRAKGRFRAGLRYVRKRPDIVLVLLVILVIGMFGFNFGIFTSTMATTEFGRGAADFGLLSSVMAIGSLAGALLAARREHPRLRMIALAAGGFGLSCGAAAFAPTFEIFAACLVAVGLSSLTLMTSANAYVQTTTPGPLRGRVMSLYMAVFLGGTPFGAPLVGAVADAFGPRWALGVAAIAGLLSAVGAIAWAARYRGLRLVYDRTAKSRLTVRTYPVSEVSAATGQLTVTQLTDGRR